VDDGPVRRFRLPAALLVSGLLAASCGSSGSHAGGDGSPAPSASGGSAKVVAIVASVDLYVGTPQRVGVGLVTNDGEQVSYGTVDFAFDYLGTAQAPQQPTPGPTASASYIITPGLKGTGEVPTLTRPSEARGIYEASGVTFQGAGYYQLTVTADVQGLGTQVSKAALAVNEQPSLPAPGQPALPTENLTMSSKDVPKAAIDSRYATEGKVPDPELHRWTIAQALKDGRPALVVFGTPVYCVSQFCGPVTDEVQQLSHEYADRAVFIHVEIWKDFDQQIVNQAAADWLYRNGDITEPWLFLIGADGTILDRWSSLWSKDEVAAELRQLPRMKGS
jgi:hypothetical protein